MPVPLISYGRACCSDYVFQFYRNKLSTSTPRKTQAFFEFVIRNGGQ
jgi:hypothetical protein